MPPQIEKGIGPAKGKRMAGPETPVLDGLA